MTPPPSASHGAAGRPGHRRVARALALAAWGCFLIWAAAVTHGGYGPGFVMAGGGVILLLHQGARRFLHLAPDNRLLLAGLLLLLAGVWRMIGAEARLLPLLLLTGGTALLVLSWKEFSRGAR